GPALRRTASLGRFARRGADRIMTPHPSTDAPACGTPGLRGPAGAATRSLPMPIIVLSPFSGKPVKVRDQDISRAIRDEENRIFYVLERGEGGGYYASPTRAGGEKELQRYMELEQKTTASATQAREQQIEDLHDATGTKRSNI